jgi:hypothetical protein
MVSLGLVSKVQKMKLYIWNQMLMQKHVGEYLKGNPLLRFDASHTCLGNWCNQMDH